MPAWLSDRDRPWLRDLLQEATAATGRPIAALAERWRSSVADPRAGRRAAIAQHVVLALLRAEAEPPRMVAVRQDLFRLAATGISHDDAVANAAHRHGLSPNQLMAQLFADLPGERTVHWPTPPDASRVLLLANLALVQGLLLHARTASLSLRGAARAVLRTAWLHGAGLKVEAVDQERAHLTWRAGPGPRGTRSLATLTPLLPWAQQYELRAECAVRHERGTLVLATGDPILPGPEPRLFDSGLERDFVRDFAAIARDWQLLREPVPIALGGAPGSAPSSGLGLAFPDFEVCHLPDGSRWLLELAGLREPKALPAKLALLSHPRCVLCLPDAHIPADLRAHPRIVAFRRRVDASVVRGVLQRLLGREGADAGG